MAISKNELASSPVSFVGTSEVVPTDTYRITPIQRDEIAAFARVISVGIASLGHAGPEGVTEHTLDYYRERLEDSTWTFLIARDQQGSVIGGLEAQYSPEGQTGHIHWVVKDPSRTIKGVATALYTEYEKMLRVKGAQYMMASIHDSNEPSLRFHEKFGFNMQDPLFAFGEGRKLKLYYKKIRK